MAIALLQQFTASTVNYAWPNRCTYLQLVMHGSGKNHGEDVVEVRLGDAGGEGMGLHMSDAGGEGVGLHMRDAGGEGVRLHITDVGRERVGLHMRYAGGSCT